MQSAKRLLDFLAVMCFLLYLDLISSNLIFNSRIGRAREEERGAAGRE